MAKRSTPDTTDAVASAADAALQVDIAAKRTGRYKFTPPATAPQTDIELCPRCYRAEDGKVRELDQRWKRRRSPCKDCQYRCEICSAPSLLAHCYSCHKLVEGGNIRERACGRCLVTMVPLGHILCAPCVRDIEDEHRIELEPHARRALAANPLPMRPLSPETTRRVQGLVNTLIEAEEDHHKGVLDWVLWRLGEMIEAGVLQTSDALLIVDAAAAEAGLTELWQRTRRGET